MKNKNGFQIYISILALLLSGCRNNNENIPDRSRIYVASLDNNWSQIEMKALDWHQDAYFTEAIIPIIVDSPRPRQPSVMFSFLSASDKLTMLIVSLNYADDAITTSLESLPQPLDDAEITRDDWQIDSGNALATLLNNDDVNYLLSHSDTQCSNLSLERRPDVQGKPVMWRILIQDCGMEDYYRYEFLDPITGDKIK